MRCAAAYCRAWVFAAALSAMVSHAQTNLPTLARICTSENKTAWVSVSGLCHVLDFYGLGKTDLPLFPSGELALKALTDDKTAIRFFGKSPLVETWHGVRYALYDEYSTGVDLGEAHKDQCLSIFASLDLPLSTPVHLKSDSLTLKDMLAESMYSFTLKQREITWSAMAFAKYVPPKTSWTNESGEEINFSKITDALLKIDLNSQKCGGTHVLEALLLIEKADRKTPVLDAATRARLDAWLKTTLAQLVKSQHDDGSWSKGWCAGLRDDSEPMSPFQMSFLVTGHLVEILNKLDPPLRPRQEIFLKAAHWISNSVNSGEIQPNGFWVCPFTHATHGAREILEPSKDKNL
jgi:hypothetical protein